MAIVTGASSTTFGYIGNAWYTVVDDVNRDNIKKINNIVSSADIVKHHKLSNPSTDLDTTISSRVEQQIDNMISTATLTSSFNSTQLKSLRMKLIHWFKNECKVILDKIDNKDNVITAVFYLDAVSKHEWIFFNVLNNLGVNVLVITKDKTNSTFKSSKAEEENYGTNENLEINSVNTSKVDEMFDDVFNNTEIVEVNRETLLDDSFLNTVDKHNGSVKTAIIGYDDEIDTLALVANIFSRYKEDNNVALVDKDIPNPTLEETSKIYRLNRNDADYIINTTKMFVKSTLVDEVQLKEAFEFELKVLDTSKKSPQMLYNKAVNLICWINRYINNNVKTFIFYGIPSENEKMFIRLLYKLQGINVILLSAKKDESIIRFIRTIVKCNGLELIKSKDNEELKFIDTNKVSTLAYNASQRVDDILYGDNSIGIYKEGQVISCNTKHLACTFDEIKLWWNKEMYIRPGFTKNGNIADIAVIFSVIRGIGGTPDEYKKTIQMFACGKTIIYKRNRFAPYATMGGNHTGPIIHNLADINGTRFTEQKPVIIGGKVQPQIIKESRNYKYSYLDMNKQNFIISKIQELLDDVKIAIPERFKGSISAESQYYDMLFNIVLNLEQEVIRNIQWFNFTDYNPNIIVISDDENTLTFEDVLYLRFLSKLGFDILVFVPTQYSSVENYLRHTEYESYSIGKPEYNLDLSGITVKADENYTAKVQEKNNKKGFFSKLFS